MKVSLWGAEYPPIEYCSASIYAVFLILYCAACITFCFTIAALFSRRKLLVVIISLQGINFYLCSNDRHDLWIAHLDPYLFYPKGCY